MDITNNSGGDITIERLYATWVDSPSTQSIDNGSLSGNLLWNQNDNDSPSDFPTEGNWVNGADRTISNTLVEPFVIQFREILAPTGYDVHIVFDIGCQVTGTK